MIHDLSLRCANTYPVHKTYRISDACTADVLVICDHDFEPAIDVIEASESGWKGFLLKYHCDMPWFDEPWKIDDISDLVSCLKKGTNLTIDKQFNSNNCALLIEFLENALKKNHDVLLQED